MVTQARKLGRQCKHCQKFKSRTKKYRHLEPKQAETLVPWHTVCVDLIGTYNLTAKVRQPDSTIKKCCELKPFFFLLSLLGEDGMGRTGVDGRIYKGLRPIEIDITV